MVSYFQYNILALIFQSILLHLEFHLILSYSLIEKKK